MNQDPPFCVQVEFTEGCNLACTFCGINGIRKKAGGPFKWMTPAVAAAAAASIAAAKWTARIEFAMHGEPSLNPEMIELVSIFHKHLPRNQLMMTSNGAGFLKNTPATVQAIFDAGLNILALDDYERVSIVPKILARLGVDPAPSAIFGTIPVHRYPEAGLQHSPHRRYPLTHEMIVVLKDISVATAGSHATINNHAGCGGPPNNTQMGVRCAKPFREFGVRWDGKVAGCCVDWRGLYHVGDVTKTPIIALWNGQAMHAMRQKLYAGERDFGPCKGCDHPSYRVGLLPDKMGKQTMAAPDKTTNAIIASALRPRPLAEIVLREWERV